MCFWKWLSFLWSRPWNKSFEQTQLSCVSKQYLKACFSLPGGLNSYIMPAVCTSWAFDSDRFQLAVDCIILDFSLLTSLHLGWPCFQHVHYWLTHCLTKFYQPGFDWITPKISRNIKMATESLLELWTFAANCLDFPCMSFGRLKQGLWYVQGYIDVGWAFGWLAAIPRVCPPQRPCVGRRWWLCFRQHGVAMCVTSPLSSQQTEGCLMAIVPSHLDDAALP